MSFISIARWRDAEDGHLYREGELFPFDGREINPERLEALVTGRNRAGLRLIASSGAKVEGEQAGKETGVKEAMEERKTVSEAKAEEPRKTARPKKTTAKKKTSK